jgi:hypothetical protein
MEPIDGRGAQGWDDMDAWTAAERRTLALAVVVK